MSILRRFHAWYVKNKYGVTYTKGEAVWAYITTILVALLGTVTFISWLSNDDDVMLWASSAMMVFSWHLLNVLRAYTRRLKWLTEKEAQNESNHSHSYVQRTD